MGFTGTLAPSNECTVDDYRWIVNITANKRTRRQLIDSIPPRVRSMLEVLVELPYVSDIVVGSKGAVIISADDNTLETIDHDHRGEFTKCDVQIAAINLALDLLVASTKNLGSV